MGQLHQARQEAVVRQLVFAIEGVCEDRPGRISNVSFTSQKKTSHKLTDVDVVFSQSHQGEEEDVPVDAPEGEDGLEDGLDS